MDTMRAETRTEAIAVTQPEQTSGPEAKSRILVLAAEVGEVALLASRIQDVARVGRREVLLVGVVPDREAEAGLRRKMALVAAFLREGGTRVQLDVVNDGECISTLRGLLNDTDLLACCVVQSAPAVGERWTRELAAEFHRPVYAFMDPGTVEASQAGPRERLAPWLGSLVIMLAFFWLQVWLSQQGSGAPFTVLLLGSVLVEVALIWLLNVLLS